MKLYRGIATIEYLVVALALVLALIIPVSDGKNSVVLIMDALKSLYAGWIYVMSTSINS